MIRFIGSSFSTCVNGRIFFVGAIAALLSLTFASCEENKMGEGPLPKKVAVVYSENYTMDLGGLERLHPFDIHKYKKIYHQLEEDGLVDQTVTDVPEEVLPSELLLIHTPRYIESLKDSKAVARYLEAPVIKNIPNRQLDEMVLKPFRFATGGTCLAARRALQEGVAINIGGGYHHAKPDTGEGFCVYADMAIAIRSLQAKGLIQRALVIDLDVHQGNGTAVCLADDEETYSFSMHQRGIYPMPKAKSDLDVEFDAGIADEEYMQLLKKHLPRVFSSAGEIDLVIYQAGCDTLKSDPLGGAKMSRAGIVARDSYVVAECVSREIPVVMTLGGGYSENAWEVQYDSLRKIISQYGQARRGVAEKN